jgi:thiamine-phosphate pyrophosphorylase
VLPRLMLVTDRHRTRGRDLVEVVACAVQGGVGLVQVRERDLPDDELRDLVLRIRDRVGPDPMLTVNGSYRVARTLGIGLHLGAGAAKLGARRPADGPFGRSAHDETEMRAALADGVDYLLLGTIFPTESKPGRRPGGLALVERICRQVHPLPVYAIGGITVRRIPPTIHAGAHGVAVCGAILSDNDPQRVAEALCLALRVARPGHVEP